MNSRTCITIPDRKLTKFYLSLSRDKLSKLVGFLTGRYQFNTHLHTIAVVTNPIYGGYSGEEETPKHILRKYSTLASYKKSILGDIWPSMAKIKEFPPSVLLRYIQQVEEREDTLIWAGEDTMDPNARPKCRLVTVSPHIRIYNPPHTVF